MPFEACFAARGEMGKSHNLLWGKAFMIQGVDSEYLAFIARYLKTKVLRNITIAALIAGLAALIRPINYS